MIERTGQDVLQCQAFRRPEGSTARYHAGPTSCSVSSPSGQLSVQYIDGSTARYVKISRPLAVLLPSYRQAVG